jgi:fatty acid desaturase
MTSRPMVALCMTVALRAEDPAAEPDRALLAAPDIAWATLALSAACLSVWVGSLLALATESLPAYVTVPLSTVAAFATFTPLHDASHQALARSRWVNEVVGRLAAIPLLFGVFGAFRYLHLEHHKFTNEPERDPDHWVALGPSWLLPLRWMTIEYPYITMYRRRLRPAKRIERFELRTALPLLVAVIAVASYMGYGRAVLFGWYLPAKVAAFLLAYAFDYLPHRPHLVPARVDRFRATIVQSDPWRTPLLLYQNYHLIHHLYPAIPFYRYSRVWRAQRETLLARGVVDTRRP